MPVPVHIVAHGLALSETDAAYLQASANKLETFFDRLVDCRVTVSIPNRRPQGAPIRYTVHISLSVPGEDLAVRRQSAEDFLSAAQKAFHAAGRRLQDYARRLSPPTVAPESRPDAGRGRVTQLHPWEGYGFLTGDDGREIYFHRNSVLREGFGQMEIGDEVRFAEEEGEKGPQASTVELSRGHGARR